jgi:hypothetical protein
VKPLIISKQAETAWDATACRSKYERLKKRCMVNSKLNSIRDECLRDLDDPPNVPPEPDPVPSVWTSMASFLWNKRQTSLEIFLTE